MEFFALSTDGLDRPDLQLWINDDTHVEAAADAAAADQYRGVAAEKLFAVGVLRCAECTLVRSLMCCPRHPQQPLSCYSTSTRRNVGVQSCVGELLCCDEADCEYHCHSRAAFDELADAGGASCALCGARCEIAFWVVSSTAFHRRSAVCRCR